MISPQVYDYCKGDISKIENYSHTKCREEYRTNNPEHLDWNTFQKKFYKKEI